MNKTEETQTIEPAPEEPPSTRRKQLFPNATQKEWNDWKWQIKNQIRTPKNISKIIDLSTDELNAIDKSKLPFAITPYYSTLISKTNPHCPIRITMVPTTAELTKNEGELDDPLAETEDSPTPNIVHRYPDRLLFLTTQTCSAYCRFCTRARSVGQKTKNNWESAIQYIKEHTEIRDVILSGGDPLTLSDEKIEWLLKQLQQIKHIEIVRIGTKVPAVLPMRITKDLVKMLKKYHPLWMSLHFTHPKELTPETSKACNMLADAGIPLGSQTVILANVNDNTQTMKDLMTGLLKIRVRPYYLYQCDPISGSEHLRTPVEKGLEIIKSLRGHTSGYAVPQFVIDAPGGGGKIPILPQYVVGKEGNDIILSNRDGEIFKYPDTKII
jgi:lysine 2,3-aminomutase